MLAALMILSCSPSLDVNSRLIANQGGLGGASPTPEPGVTLAPEPTATKNLCGNNLCEPDETYNSCREDCNFPFVENNNGYVYIKDGHLFRNGGRVRLWGVNDHWSLPKSDAEQDAMATRLKSLGFNAVRLWMQDFWFISHAKDAELLRILHYAHPEIAAPANPSENTRKMIQYKKGDLSFADRFDSFVYRLKQKGVMIYMSFDRDAEPFVAEDGIGVDGYGSIDAWKAAMNGSPNKNQLHRSLIYADDRLRALHQEWARNLLRHVNQYTEKRYADEETVALWELTNENMFIPMFTIKKVEWQSGVWNNYFENSVHPFFIDEMRHKWNAWLARKYNSHANMLAAWGCLMSGENLEQATVQLGPAWVPTSERDPCLYNVKRENDYLSFIFSIYDSHNSEMVELARAEGVRVPILYSTNVASQDTTLGLWHKYANARGEVYSTDAYDCMSNACGLDLGSDNPFYPWKNLLFSPPLMKVEKTLGKPVIVYEGNRFRPYQYSYELPSRLASHLSYNDYDGLFWFAWMDAIPRNLMKGSDSLSYPLMLNHEGDFWGTTLHNDEILLSQMLPAGEMFKRFYLPKVVAPTQFKFGGDFIFSLNSIGNVGVLEAMSYRAGTPYLNAVTMDFSENATGAEIKGDVMLPNQFASLGGFTNSAGVAYDWREGEFSVVTESAVAMARAIAHPSESGSVGMEIGDVRIRNMSVDSNVSYELDTGAGYQRRFFSDSYHALAVVARDGHSIRNSGDILISLASKSLNTGSKFRMLQHPGWIEYSREEGTIPIQVARVEAEILIRNSNRGLWCRKLDFSMQPISDQPCDTWAEGIRVTQRKNENVFVIEIHAP